MKVKTLIKKLEKMDPEAEVRLHDKSGEPVLFVLCAKKYPDVWLQTEGDVDMSDEIQARFDDAMNHCINLLILKIVTMSLLQWKK